MSVFLRIECLVFINFYYLCYFESDAKFTVREQDKIHAVEGKRRTQILEDSYPESIQQLEQLEPVEFKIDDGIMSKIRKKKKRVARKKKHTQWNLDENMPKDKEVNKKLRKVYWKRKDKEDKDKKKKFVKDSRRFIKTAIREAEDSADSIESMKKLGPVDIIVHIKMNDMN